MGTDCLFIPDSEHCHQMTFHPLGTYQHEVDGAVAVCLASVPWAVALWSEVLMEHPGTEEEGPGQGFSACRLVAQICLKRSEVP